MSHFVSCNIGLQKDTVIWPVMMVCLALWNANALKDPASGPSSTLASHSIKSSLVADAGWQRKQRMQKVSEG